MKIIEVENLIKKFRIPHDRRDSVKEAVVGFFKKNGHEVFNAVDNLTFDVKKGEFFGIIGRNGSGKSTLLKMLAGIYKLTSGDIKMRGRIAPFLELGVGFNPELSGRDNVFLNGSILGLTEREIVEKYNEIVGFADLRRFMDQKLKNYSSGMQVRLAFSIAIQAGADILLLDEVLAVGDADFQRKCFEKFREFKKAGKTIVFVTHDLGAVRQFCDRVLYIKSGKAVMIGGVADVIDKYIYEDRLDEFVEKINERDQGQLKVGDEQQSIDTIENVDSGSKEIEITKVEYLDHEGRNNEKFVSGDSMTIRVYYRRHKKVDSVVCGIALYKDDGYHLYGTNSFLQNKKIELEDFGYVDFKAESLNLLSGDYALTIAFCDEVGKSYDWRDKEFYFTVIKASADDGIVDMRFNLID